MPRNEANPKNQQQLMREIYRLAKIGTWEVRNDESLVWSDETHEIFGLNRNNFSGAIDDFFGLVHPDDLEQVKMLDDFTGSNSSSFKSEYRILRPDGELRHMRQTAIVLRDETGHPNGFSGVVQDVTDQVETDAKLRQSQKLEAIGQFSGGVAHDFNNILASIIGAAELMRIEDAYDPELVRSIISSAKRGGELTHRLLAFARKQPLSKTKVDVKQLITEIVPMIDRIIGQDIKLEVARFDQVKPIEADPAQLHEALVNLALNARDAISGTGTITITCQNTVSSVPNGGHREYVEIALRDTGSGMSEYVRQQATVPFFTTKPVGKGSGLGLSMVDGYVKQSGGKMELHSTPGSGTRISILMPTVDVAAQSTPSDQAEVGQGNGERILVIEDNLEIARLTQRQLVKLNYLVCLATNRQSALIEAKRAGGIDIVLSDIILSNGERGPVIVNELLGLYPDMKPIYMTGFAPDSEEISGVLNPVRFILQKPFTTQQLSQTLKRMVEFSPKRYS